MPLLTVETLSESAFEVDGVEEASVPVTDDAGNALVGSGLSLLRERLFGCLVLSEVGLMLAGGGGGGGAWETGGAWSARSEKKKHIFNFSLMTECM